jgi:hypothetical protein
MQTDADFRPNGDCTRDLSNVAVGIVWQLTLVTFPIYLVLRDWPWTIGSAAVLAITSIYLKFRWYDRLEKAPISATAPQLVTGGKEEPGERSREKSF